MKTVFNFTDREDRISKTGINPEILIRVADKNSNTVYTPEINIKKKIKYCIFLIICDKH